MEDLDFRQAAERLVEKIHISDPEWKEILVETYEEILRKQREPPRILKLVANDYFLSL